MAVSESGAFPLGGFSSEKAMIGKYSISQLIESYRFELFEDYLPFSNKYSVDYELGGFFCNLNDDGSPINYGKRLWYLGRGSWVYSYLYNNLQPDPENAEIARKAIEFTLTHVPVDSWSWPASFTREGAPTGKDERISGVNFVSEGLSEFSRIKGNEKYWDLGKKCLLMMVDKYDNDPNYYEIWKPDDEKYIKRARVQGNWMTTTHISTQMMETHPDDKELKTLSDRCIDAVLNYHWNPEYRLNNENLNHDLSRPSNSNSRHCIVGHSVETMWMIMKEAVRRRDRELFDIASQRFRRHIEVGWDDVYGGLYNQLEDIETNTFQLTKSCWAQEECLIGLLMIIEHTGAEWAKELFDKIYSYVFDKFPKRKYGFSGWMVGSNRKVEFRPGEGRWENYHHPRHLMFNYLALKRIEKNKGRISGVFS
jgi:mannose/cellobiose epimerase-like protein (N-acyl-D-glucosamine 2-epimerase family)